MLHPLRDEVFTVVAGEAAHVNGVPLRPSAKTDLATAVVATGFAYDAAVRARQAEIVARVIPRAADIRRIGSAALDLAWTAAGRVDAFYEHGGSAWDVAAGRMLCAAAGLEVRDLPARDGLPPGTLAAPADVRRGALRDRALTTYCAGLRRFGRMVRHQTSDGGEREGPSRTREGRALALSRRTVPLTAALAVVGLLMLAGSAFGADQRVVKIQDDCDPATFNAALGAGACVGAGETTFQDLLAQFAATGSVDKWQFSRPDFNIDAGGTITVVDEGGEAHTFTGSPSSGTAAARSTTANRWPAASTARRSTRRASIVLPGGPPLTVGDLAPGTVVRFQCMIHPWMRSTVDVRAKGNRGGRG